MARLHSLAAFVALFVLLACHVTALELDRSHSHSLLDSQSFLSSSHTREKVTEKCGEDFHHYIEHTRTDKRGDKYVSDIDCYAVHRCENRRPPKVIQYAHGSDIQCESTEAAKSQPISCPAPSVFSHLVQKTIDATALPKLVYLEQGEEDGVDIQAAVCESPFECDKKYDTDPPAFCKYLITCQDVLGAELEVKTDAEGVQSLHCVTPAVPEDQLCKQLHPDDVNIKGEIAVENKFFREECIHRQGACAKYARSVLDIRGSEARSWVGTYLCKKSLAMKQPKKRKVLKKKKPKMPNAWEQTLLCGPRGPIENLGSPEETFFSDVSEFTSKFSKAGTKISLLRDKSGSTREQVELKEHAIDVQDPKKVACVYGCYALFARALEAEKLDGFDFASYRKAQSGTAELKKDDSGLAMCRSLYASNDAVSQDSPMHRKLKSETSIAVITSRMQDTYEGLKLKPFTEDVFSLSCRDWCQGLLIARYTPPRGLEAIRPRTLNECAYVCAIKK
eukprot:GILJ01000683.1.p1 GENE.GILJ01000683.1~~GILJ01000683.1.p1  ORF type:complete len:505 (-),score=62.16 GILJ01000683.1:229-1743(-)